MDKNTKSLLVAQHIPPHVQNLLELVGVFYLADLMDIDEAFIKNVEEQIRAGSVLNQINFESKANRIKYFGIDHNDVGSFEFRILDRMKFLRLAAAAEEKLNGVQWIEDEAEKPDDDRLNRITLKIVDDSNAWLASTDFKHEVDRSHVSVSFGESGKASFKILCQICEPKKHISLMSTKYSASIANFSRHVSNFHKKKSSTPQVKVEPQEPSSSKSKKATKGKSQKRNLLELLGSDQEIEEQAKTPPKKKKNKSELPEVEIDDTENQQVSRIAHKIVDDANAFLSPTDLMGKVDRSHVTAHRGDSGKIYYKIQCLICGKIISVNSTQYSASITNFKRHFETLHIEKTDVSVS